MENKEIFIPISKIKGLDKLKNQLDFKIEKISTDGIEQEFDALETNSFDVENKINLNSHQKSLDVNNFNINISELPKLDEKFLQVNFKSFMDLVSNFKEDLSEFDNEIIVVNSQFLMRFINSNKLTNANSTDLSQMIRGILFGVLISIFLFLFIKLI